MKDSKVYAPKIKKLQTSLKKAYGQVKSVSYDDPIESVIAAMISEPIPASKVRAVEKQMKDYFVSLNDLRVARPEEITEIVGSSDEAVREMAIALGQVLNDIFDEHHLMTLEPIEKLGKRQAKQALEELTGITPFAVSYCMLTSFQGHAIPVNAKMIEYLKAEELVHPDATPESIEGFLTKQIATKDDFEFYTQLRAESEASSRSRKVASKAKTKKKTTKKKVTKKTTKKVAKKATKKTTKKKTTKK